jgi:hypothetical protein
MISMASSTIISVIRGGDRGLFVVILLLILLSSVEILNGKPLVIRRRFAPFIDTCNAIIIPFLLVFTIIVSIRIIMIL